MACFIINVVVVPVFVRPSSVGDNVFTPSTVMSLKDAELYQRAFYA